mmetsp:Transcript_44035/g.95785  ORF Transcript_44035/g.95785 Transcript_44035/m.95785 type:complete len:257 (-) Transcript_44035:325-1095(-)
MHVHILRTEVAPLEAIDRAQVHLLTMGKAALVQELTGAVSVPDLHALVRKVLRIGVTLNEPEELLHDAAPEGPLRGQERERLPQVESHLRPENRAGADTCAVLHVDTVLDDLPDLVEVLVLLMEELPGAAGRQERGGFLLDPGCEVGIRGARALVDCEVIGQHVLALRLAHMDDLELLIVKGREEDITLHVLAHARDEDARAVGHIHGLLIGLLPADYKDLLHILAAHEGLHSAWHRGRHDDALGVRRDEARLRRG